MTATISPPRQRASLPGGFPVLESKLRAPTWRHGHISRPRLVAQLDAVRDLPLVVLSGPAGSGKSTLLAEWASAVARPVTWIQVDERDDDPAVLLRYVALGLHRAVGLSDAQLRAATAGGPSVWTAAAPSLGAAIAAVREPFLLVLDDVDRISNRETLDVIVALTAHLPEGAQIALGTRTMDGLPIARLTAADRVAVVDWRHLQFDDAEAAGLLAEAGLVRTDDEVRAMNAGAEGWAAGLYLTALSARSAAPGQVSDSPTPGRGLVGEYLRTELLDQLSPSVHDFLLGTALLERLCAPLCDDVLGTDDSAAMLDELERSNLFLIPVDDERQWYRYHSLFRGHLVTEAQRRSPGREVEIAHRAAAWYEADGDQETALRYAVAALDHARIGRLLPEVAHRAFAAGHLESVRAWYDWLDGHDRDAAPYPVEAAAAGALFFALMGEPIPAQTWADRAGAHVSDGDRLGLGLVAIANAMLARRGADGMFDDAEAAARSIPIEHPLGPAARVLAAIAHDHLGRSDIADQHLAVAVDEAISADRQTSSAIGLVYRASIAIRSGDWTDAESHTRRARAVVHEGGLAEQMPGLAADAVAARIAIHRGALTQARNDLAHVQRLRPILDHAIPWLAIRVRLELVACHLALSDAGAARVLMAEIDDIRARRPGIGAMAIEVEALRHRLDAARGRISGTSTLTAAELRLMPLLATHLTFPEIAERMVLSSNTVKTQAKSIYRKLEAASRGEAVDAARRSGLLEAPGYPDDARLRVG